MTLPLGGAMASSGGFWGGRVLAGVVCGACAGVPLAQVRSGAGGGCSGARGWCGQTGSSA